MKLEEIFAGESKNLEFKESLPVKSSKYMKTIVAFANGQGGKLIIGVEDDTKKLLALIKMKLLRLWTLLLMLYLTAVSLPLFQIFICRQLMRRRLLLWI